MAAAIRFDSVSAPYDDVFCTVHASRLPFPEASEIIWLRNELALNARKDVSGVACRTSLARLG